MARRLCGALHLHRKPVRRGTHRFDQVQMRDKRDMAAASRRGFLFAAIPALLPALLRAQFKPANPPPDQTPPQPGQPAPVLKKAEQDSTDAQKTPTFSAGVKVVNVFAAVRDKNGQVLKDLSK